MIRIDSQTNSSHLKDEFQVLFLRFLLKPLQFVPGTDNFFRKVLSSQMYNLTLLQLEYDICVFHYIHWEFIFY